MYQRLVFTVATAVSLMGLYVLYSLAMRPVVVIPVPQAQKVEDSHYAEPELPAENVRIAETYLKDEKWPARAEHMLHFEQAFVYTNDWEQDEVNRKSVRFKPFAMVWLTVNQAGEQEALSIVSDSAQLEFLSPFDEKNTNPGRIVGALLNGEVIVTGPNGLAIKGHDFIFAENTLSLATWKKVDFRFQSHQGSAAKMLMKLIPAQGAPRNDRPHVQGVESVRLIAGPNLSDPNNPNVNHNVNLKVQMPQGDKLVPVNVRCTGDLLYTFSNTTAVLTQDVKAGTTGKSADWLECDTLTMRFTPKKVVPNEQTAEANQRPPEYQKIETDLEFSSLEADGRIVKVFSRSHGSTAEMTHLSYSAETKMLSMKAQALPNGVVVKRKRSVLQAPEIEAQFDEKNSPTSLLCLGAGKLTFVDDQTNQLKFVATWQKRLSKKTDDATKLDLIELDEKATFVQREQNTGLAAELIKIWLEPMEFAFSPSSPNPEGGEPAKTPDPKPKRLLAQGDVALSSPQMQIERTNELDIRFEDADDATPTAISQKSRSQLQLAGLTVPGERKAVRPTSTTAKSTTAKIPKSTTRRQGFANVPAEPDRSLGPSVDIPFDAPSPRRQKPRLPPTEPFVVSAERIFARMQQVPGNQKADVPEVSVQEVRGEGKVNITQKRKTGEKDLSLRGDRVHLQGTESDKQQVIHVVGTPALIQDQGFKIEGKDIHLDRGKNHARVSGSGDLTLPIPEKPNATGMEGVAHGDLRVHWVESMDFDGLDAKFIGKVEAKLGLGKMFCEQMVVQLADRLSFQQENFESNPALKIIHCRENVRFENSTYLMKKLVDVYRGYVGEFTLNYLTHDVVAQGPGEILVWRRKPDESGGFEQRETIQANRPISTEVAVWDYTQVQFEGLLKGTFAGQTPGFPTRQRATIDDRVEVIHGPVNLPNERVNPDRLPSLGGTMRCDQLQVVNHPESESGAKKYLELVGRGNAEVEGQVNGQRFTASADEISYDGSKSLYMLRAHGRQNARLTGIALGNQSGRRIEFNPDPKLRILNVSGATEGQVSQ